MSISALISLLIGLIIIGAILYLVWWAISQIPMIEPVRVVVMVVFALIAILILVKLLLPLAGMAVL